MREISGKHEGDLTVDDHVSIGGQVVGTVRVADGGDVELHGQVTRDLVIEGGGRAVVHGQVVRDVVNRGRLELFGMVIGELHTDGGTSEVHPNAAVGSRRP